MLRSSLLLCLTAARQQFLLQPVNLTVDPAAAALIECTVQDRLGECWWSREGRPVGLHLGDTE